MNASRTESLYNIFLFIIFTRLYTRVIFNVVVHYSHYLWNEFQPLKELLSSRLAIAVNIEVETGRGFPAINLAGGAINFFRGNTKSALTSLGYVSRRQTC